MSQVASFHLNKSGTTPIEDLLFKYDLGSHGGQGFWNIAFIIDWIYTMSSAFLEQQTSPIEFWTNKTEKLWVEPFLEKVAEKVGWFV